MPKQFYKLNDFSGGLNHIRDARDIAPNELTEANNLSLGVAGSIRTANELNGTDGALIPRLSNVRVYPGGGLFYYETDKESGAAAQNIGERWTAVLGSYLTGAVQIHGQAAGDINVVEMGIPQRVDFATNELKFEDQSITRGTAGGSINFTDYFQEGDVAIISGCTDTAANNLIVRIAKIHNTGASMLTSTTFTTEASEAGTIRFDKYANGIFFASDDTLRITDGGFGTGLIRQQYGYIKQVHFEDAGVAKDSYDNWYVNNCDLPSPTALLIHGSSYPAAGAGFHLNLTHPATSADVIGQFAAKTYQIACTFIYKDNQESKLYVPTSTNTFTIAANDYINVEVNASPAYDERIIGARVYMRADGTSESWSLMIDMDLRAGCRTSIDDEYKSWAVGGGASEAGVDGLILTSENFETYTTLNGFGPDEPSITLGIRGEGFKDCVIANRRLFVCNVQMIDELDDGFSNSTLAHNDDPTITIDSTALLRHGMSVTGAATIPTGAYVNFVNDATTFELSVSTTGGVLGSQTATFANIMRRMRDRIMYTPPGKYETFPRSFFIDVVKGDSDEYTALATYGDRLFAFKRQTLYILNIGSPSPSNWFLESTERNKGIASKAAVFSGQDGIYWANKYGAFFFNGSNIVNLIKGKIPQATWIEKIGISDAHHCSVAFHEKTNNIYILANNLSLNATADNEGVYVYNFDTRAWTWQDQDATSQGVDKIFSNFISDGEGGIVFLIGGSGSYSGTTTKAGISEAANGDAVSATKWIMKTKDIDFGSTSRIKKVYGLRITYKSSAAQTTPISYATNGGSSFTNFTGNFIDTSNAWDILNATLASPVKCQSMQIKITNPTSTGTININDISIEYRTIRKKVT
jgi:hypothetical protein